MRQALVTIVIPTRNRLVLLRDAVESVLCQTVDYWRLIIVDDASEDGTSDWVETLDDDRISYIRLESHSERSMARNRGLADCRSPYVLFFDDDDLLETRALEVLVDALQRSSNVVAAVGACLFFDADGHEYALPHPAHTCERRVWAELIWGWVGHTWRTLFRTELIRALGGFTESLVMGEDRDLWFRLVHMGPAILIPDVVARYRIHSGQWRPADAERLDDVITRRALAAGSPRDRSIGERVIKYRHKYDDAYTALNDTRHREALRLFATVWRAPSSLFMSPVVRGPILSGIRRAALGAIIGPRGVAAVRRLRRASRRLLGRSMNDESWNVPSPKRANLD